MFTFRRIARVAIVVVVLTLAVNMVASAQGGLPPTPNMKFPWDSGQAKTWTTGPHSSFGPSSGKYCTFVSWNDLRGLDFAGSFAVLAMHDGNVESCGAGCVRVRHGSGWATDYAHLSAVYVSSGWVPQGRVIGYTGTTSCGGCGTHLHVDIRYLNPPQTAFWDDKVVDGWRIHNAYNSSGQPLYAEGTATREGTSWGWANGTISDYFCGQNKPGRFLVGPKWQTVVTDGSRIVSQQGAYAGATYGTSASEFQFVSSNQRR